MILLNITGHEVEKLEDPFGLLPGDRYEFFLELDVDMEDELYSDKGIGLKVIYVSEETGDKITSYYFYERGSETVLDFALEEDEEELVLTYCQQHRVE
ncbi:pullulanase [Neobacillus sp. MM2021_6]|uniref:DUF6509 family protein n=1 Tax=Bacillaceae TaxID=186817 RepID=UPI00140BF66D|nr:MULTISPECIES: DUF6509 family protein [Bacillaceae]MBO0958343.1 pullulanase [Neobacillus sp. MM2021_6]NHC17943.1 pullulanase [Bacillus sp. MM2020_4]WML40193.1 DUF6509 family protein [Neobacillus sp. OS1-2]